MALEVSFRNIRPRDEIKKRGEARIAGDERAVSRCHIQPVG